MEQRRIASSRILNGLSVDVEDWFQVGAFENTIDRADWDGLSLRVADNVKFVLDLFDPAEESDILHARLGGGARACRDESHHRTRA